MLGLGHSTVAVPVPAGKVAAWGLAELGLGSEPAVRACKTAAPGEIPGPVLGLDTAGVPMRVGKIAALEVH